MPNGRANGTSPDGMGSFDGVHFLLNDGQEAQSQKDGEGKTIGHTNTDEPGHQVADICGPDKDEGCQHHNRDAQEKLQTSVKTLLSESNAGNLDKAGG